jgi:hypothetical protein
MPGGMRATSISILGGGGGGESKKKKSFFICVFGWLKKKYIAKLKHR